MHRRTIAAFIAISLAPIVAVGAPSGPPAAISKLTNAIVVGTSKGDSSVFARIFTADATVVDENDPYVWRGADAGVAWWDGVEAVMLKEHITSLKPTDVRNGEFKSSATAAYLVQAMTIRGIKGGKPFAEAGTMTYTFRNAGGTWLISSMVWTTKP